MKYTILKSCRISRARNGILSLPHGMVSTPAFMPVGTNASVKAITQKRLDELNYRIILANTYHLYLRPGIEVIKKFGGLHNYCGWKGNILTDSGGYQIFSLSVLRKIENEGVFFKSHIDGSGHKLTPEDVISVQKDLNSDIIMPLDVCTPAGIPHDEALKALQITTKWAARSQTKWLEYGDKINGSLFGIIQGNFYRDLRKRSAEELIKLDLPGMAIGGLSVGESAAQFNDFLNFTSLFLPPNIPHYLMGIGTPEYILSAVENGIDIFDCVYPTRIARNGMFFTNNGTMTIKNAKYKIDKKPIDELCNCYTCMNFSRAYIRHLFKAKEIMGPILGTEHNLYFLQKFMEDIRKSIDGDFFPEFKRNFLYNYTKGDAKN